MNRLIVERRFERPLGEDELARMMVRLGRWIHDAEAVRLANREAGVAFEAV
jgi:hypothetical protein